MILFKDYHVKPILRGRKTQTRRVWKKQRAKVGSIHKVKTMMLSKDYHCKIKILDVRQERLGDISADDVWAEGYPSLDEYVDAWIEINGSFDPDLVVYVVTFAVLAEATAGLDELLAEASAGLDELLAEATDGIDELLEEAQHGIDEVTLGTDEAMDDWPTESDIAELGEIDRFLEEGGSYAKK